MSGLKDIGVLTFVVGEVAGELKVVFDTLSWLNDIVKIYLPVKWLKSLEHEKIAQLK